MNATISDITVVIPSLNPDEKLAQTVDALIKAGFTDIVLINDGSASEYVPFFPTSCPQCTLLTHPVNRGKGAALKTAFRYILDRKKAFSGIITVDGDGQHKAEDVLRCAEVMQSENTIVLGVRDFSLPHIPPRSRFGNRMTSLVFHLFCGLKISDTQTGLRAIPAQYLPPLLDVAGDRYEYETNMLLQMKALSLPFSETKIETVYIEENQTSHFRPLRDSLRIYGLILRFMAASFLSSLLDLGLFFFLSCFLPNWLGAAADAVCTCIARICSSLFNYSLNRKRVFHSRVPTKTSLLRYYILAAGILLLSSVSITAVSLLFGMTDGSYAFMKTVCKFVIDSILFLVSFRLQQDWVFAEKTSTTKKH